MPRTRTARRSSVKPNKASYNVPEVIQAFVARRIVDAVAVTLCVLGAFLIGSLSSYSTLDPSANSAVDDILDVIREQAEEDLLSMGQAVWEVDASVKEHFKARLPWLLFAFTAGVGCFSSAAKTFNFLLLKSTSGFFSLTPIRPTTSFVRVAKPRLLNTLILILRS